MPAGCAPSFSGRIPELDGIRGVAIVLVLIYHYAIQTYTMPTGSLGYYVLMPGRLGWTGVDFFFVLSGFLIGGILLDARDSRNYFRVFYTRRFFRIVPIYAVFLFCLFVLAGVNNAHLLPGRAWVTKGLFPWYTYAFFLQNFWIAFGNSWGPSASSITWSLAVEEQFYLTLPFLVRFLNRKRLIQILLEGLILAPVLRTMLYALWPTALNSWFVLMPCRADALLFGVLAAIALRDPHSKLWLENHRKLILASILTLAALVPVLTKMYFAPYGLLTASLGLSCIAALYTTILVYALLFSSSIIGRLLRLGWLRWLGGIAYGVYLFHQIVLEMIFGSIWRGAPLIYNLRQAAVCIFALGVTLVLCRLSWAFFEKPLIRVGHRTHYETG